MNQASVKADTRPIVRPATRADLDAFYAGRGARPTVTALVGELDGEVIAIGGIAETDGKSIAFFDMTDRARRYPIRIVKVARQILAQAVAKGAIVHAQRDLNEPGAERFLEHLGFRPADGGRMHFVRRNRCQRSDAR